jgi:hypothetical protein
MFKRPLPRALALTALKVVGLSVFAILDMAFMAQYVPVKVHALVGTMIFFLVTFLVGEAIFMPTRLLAHKVFGWVAILYVWESFLGAMLWMGFLGDASVLFNQRLQDHAIMFVIYGAAMFAAWYDVKRLGGSRYSEGLM